MKQNTILLVVALGASVFLQALPARAGEDCVQKVEANCTSCHYQSRICEQLGKKSRRSWKVTIKRMLRYGLQLQGTSQEEMLECLLNLEKDSARLCK